MANLKALKTKRQSIIKTRKVTRAMEAVSAVKMRKAQESALGGRAYANGALRILRNLSNTVETQNHPLREKRTKGKKAHYCKLWATPSRSLCKGQKSHGSNRPDITAKEKKKQANHYSAHANPLQASQQNQYKALKPYS